MNRVKKKIVKSTMDFNIFKLRLLLPGRYVLTGNNDIIISLIHHNERIIFYQLRTCCRPLYVLLRNKEDVIDVINKIKKLKSLESRLRVIGREYG